MTLTLRIERTSRGETKVKIWIMTSSGAAERDAEGKNSEASRIVGVMDAVNCMWDWQGRFRGRGRGQERMLRRDR